MATKPPKLKTLKARPCSLEELQAALVTLIEMHNGLAADINKMLASGQIKSRHEAMMTRPYGL